MAEIIIITSVSLIFLLILIQKLSIRFLYKNDFSAELDYSFLRIILTDVGKNKKLGKISPKLFLPIKRALEFLLSKSELKITEIRLKTKENDPSKFGVRYRNIFSLFSAAAVYLSKTAKKLSLSDNSIIILSDPEEESKYTIDITIITPLYIFALTAAKFLIISLKNKKKFKKQSEKKNA